jgi:molecular chaperone Hsp33
MEVVAERTASKQRLRPIIVATYETRALQQSQSAPGRLVTARAQNRARETTRRTSYAAIRNSRRSQAVTGNSVSDSLHGFVFEHAAVRGAIVQLEAAWRFMRTLRAYPDAVEALLGEAVVAAALLASTLKRNHASLQLQMQGDGALKLLLTECSSDYGLRATARWSDPIAHAPLNQLIGTGRCVITLGGSGGARYQGIVPIESASLVQALEDYMRRSEQLDTRMVLHADHDTAVGLLVQRVPDRSDADPDDWNRVQHLAGTASATELRALPVSTLLRRLFPQDDVRLFDGRALRFACTCSAQRVQSMLTGLGRSEVEEVLEERGNMEVTCEFCGQRYVFSAEQCRALFS